MQAVILAAGLGIRMGELTKDTPKPLLKINNETLLEHNLQALPDEVNEVILVVGYLGDKIRALIGNDFAEKKIVYVKQAELKGTAHALFQCKDFLEDRFLVIHGDDLYSKKDLEELVKHPSAVLVWEMKNDEFNQDRQGLVKTNEKGEVINIVERQPARAGGLVNTGAYVLNKKLFDYPLVAAGQPANEYGLPQTFLQMVKDGERFSVVKATSWHKVAGPQDLLSWPASRDPKT